jgi:hypothetical protein
MLDQSAARFKRKRKGRFVEESSGSKRIWLWMLIGGLLLFLWNEIGGIFRVRTPFSVILETAGNWMDASLGTGYFGADLLRGILLARQTGRLDPGLFQRSFPAFDCAGNYSLNAAVPSRALSAVGS